MSAEAVHDFGMLLKSYRVAAGLSQGELAERAGMSRSAISALERGLNRRPHRDTVHLLAVALALGPLERAALEVARTQSRPLLSPSLASQVGNSSHSGITVPLVGRVRELDRLWRHHIQVGPPALFVAGEPGIGKSRLLHETALRAQAAGWSVLRGACLPHGAQQPYSPLLDALAAWIHSRPMRQLRQDLEGCGWLVRLMPELMEYDWVVPPSWSLSPDQERRLLFAAAERFLKNVAGPAGTLLVLDDLQWAGMDAAMLLEELVRSTESLRLIGAYRPTDVGSEHPLVTLFADLGRDGLSEEMELGPLSPGDSVALVEHVLAQVSAIRDRKRLTQTLVARGGGVPFFLVSSARAIGASGETAGNAAAVIPVTVQQSIEQRLAVLPRGAHEILALVSMLGRPADLALLESLAVRVGLSPEGTFRALDAALRSRLLLELEGEGGEWERAGPTRYAITHDLMREVILDEVVGGRRGWFGRIIAETLEARLLDGQSSRDARDAILEVMSHLIEAGERARALPYALSAGQHAEAMYAYTEAVRYYQMALDLARAVLDVPRQAEALLALGRTLHHLGRADAAKARLAEASGLYEALGDLNGAMDAASEYLLICAEQGNVADGLHFADRLVAQVKNRSQAGMQRALARLHNSLANLFFMGGRYEKQLEAATLAEQLAREAEDDELLATALFQSVLGMWNTRSFAETLPRFLELIPRVEQRRDAWLLFRVLNTVAEMLLYRGEFARGKPYQERALDVLQRFVIEPSRVAFEMGNTGNYAYYLGEWARARDYCERALVLMRTVDPTGVALRSAYVHLWLGKLDIVEGRTDAGEAHLERALAIAGPGGDLQALRHAHAVLAERDLLAGRPAEALSRLQPLLDRPGLQEPNVTMRLLPLVAWAELELGHVGGAVRWATAAVKRAIDTNAGFALVDAWRVQALIDIQRRRWRAAEAALQNSLSRAQTMPYPYAEAKALYVYGLLETAREQHGTARAHLASAASVLRRLGERLYAHYIESRLANLSPSAPQT